MCIQGWHGKVVRCVVRQHRPNERDDNRCLLVSEGNEEVGGGPTWSRPAR
jgi:hypothetical protein